MKKTKWFYAAMISLVAFVVLAFFADDATFFLLCFVALALFVLFSWKNKAAQPQNK